MMKLPEYIQLQILQKEENCILLKFSCIISILSSLYTRMPYNTSLHSSGTRISFFTICCFFSGSDLTTKIFFNLYCINGDETTDKYNSTVIFIMYLYLTKGNESCFMDLLTWLLWDRGLHVRTSVWCPLLSVSSCPPRLLLPRSYAHIRFLPRMRTFPWNSSRLCRWSWVTTRIHRGSLYYTHILLPCVIHFPHMHIPIISSSSNSLQILDQEKKIESPGTDVVFFTFINQFTLISFDFLSHLDSINGLHNTLI